MKLEDLKPETDFEKMYFGALLARLRGIPIEYKIGDDEDWQTFNLPKGNLEELRFRIKPMKLKVNPEFWKMFPETNYVTRDKNGCWYGYKMKPYTGKEAWCRKVDDTAPYLDLGNAFVVINGDTVDWAESLIVRPNFEEKAE